MIPRSLLAITLVTLSSPALAHPGHGHGEGFSLLHYLSAPEHAWTLVLGAGLGAAVVGGAWYLRRLRKGRQEQR